jgi:polyisoprenyl-teichoic acid--peptidoglycan teichoic acid transferase
MRGNTVRRQVLVYAGIALAVAAGAVGWFLFGQDRGDSLFDHGDRVNVLLMGQNENRSLCGMTLVSFSETDIILFSLPVDLRMRDASGRFARAADVYGEEGPLTTAEAVGALIGMNVPLYLSCGLDLLRTWIDELGGLVIELDATAAYIDTARDTPLRVEIRPGMQTLDASEAVAFATSPSEPEDIGLLKRQQVLLEALLRQGIGSSDMRSVRNRMREVHESLTTNISQTGLLQAVEILRRIPEGNLRAGELAGEMVEIDGVTYTQPNVVATERLVAALLKNLELLTPGDVKVAVFNGNGVRLMARRTADYLLARGFQVTGVANADTFDYQTSYVMVLTDESKAWMLRDALPSEAQIVFPETFTSHYEALRDYIPAGTDIVLIAGAGLEIE